MWGIVSGVFGALKAGLEYLGLRQRRAERADAEKTGAVKQAAANQAQQIAQQRDQLKVAGDYKPGQAQNDLENGTF